MAVPLLDMKRQYDKIKDELNQAVINVLEHGRFIFGPEVTELENQIAAYCDVEHGIGVASGTDALLLSLRAAGVGPGDEVITSDYSFISSTTVISRVGATPVFVDIEEDTYNMNPELLAKAVTPRTKAIMPVHLFGQCADMDPIMKIADKHNLAVIEDAAQAIGSHYRNKKAGSFGGYGCISFYPTKNLGGAGDGGMVVTNSDDNADKLKMFRNHGWKKKYHPTEIGYNSRLDSIQAAVLLVKLKSLAEATELRRAHAARYTAAFAGTKVKAPVEKDYSYHIYNQYTIAVENRDELLKALQEKNIGHEIYYPLPFHLLECYPDLPYKKGDFPNSEKAAESVVSIPVFPELTEAELEEVIEAVTAVSG